MLLRGGRIQTGFGLFVPRGLRAGALVANCFAVGRTECFWCFDSIEGSVTRSTKRQLSYSDQPRLNFLAVG